MDTRRPLSSESRCPLCASNAACARDPGILVRRLAAGEELPLPRRGRPGLTIHVVCHGALKTVHHGRDGRYTISALHLRGEAVQPAVGSRGRVHHIATRDSIVRSREIDTAEDAALTARLLTTGDRKVLRETARLVRLAGGKPVPSLAGMILDLADRGPGPDGPVEIPINRSEVASYLGFEPETVSRAFASLVRSGAIRRYGWARVEIVDAGRLAGLSEA
ncbi:MAG: Crp/Fnr family transcriptional regulator [Jannaschia sp.]